MAPAAKADVCVIGRTNFATGIGSIAYAACELLSRYYSVSLFPVHSGDVQARTVRLPSGRLIPVVGSPAGARAIFYADVLWNGENDLNYTKVPDDAFRVAHVAYDSDQLPERWVEILNTRFDVVYFTSRHLCSVAQESGVAIPVGSLPIGLDLAPLLCALPTPRSSAVTFGSVASFHQRKGTDVLVQAFLDEFGDSPDVQLSLHSNLSFGEFPTYLRDLVAMSGARNVHMSTNPLTRAEVVTLMKSFDACVSCSMGEGYSIGPREALALGKSLVLSELGAHDDLVGVDGVFSIPVTERRPARYPEIDGRVFGSQFAPSVRDSRLALRTAFEYIRNERAAPDAVRRRRLRAAEFSFERLAAAYAQTVSPDIGRSRVHLRPSPYVVMPVEAKRVARSRIGRFGAHLTTNDRLVVPAFDDSLLGVLNAFMDVLVDSAALDRTPMVLPDWDIKQVFGKEVARLRYFRYYSEGTENLWGSLFEPMYGIPQRLLDRHGFLYNRSEVRRPVPEDDGLGLYGGDPARRLSAPDFARVRRLYAKYWGRYVRLAANRQAEIDALRRELVGKRVVGVSAPENLAAYASPCVEEIAASIRAWFNDSDTGDSVLVLDSASDWLAADLGKIFPAVMRLVQKGPADAAAQGLDPAADEWPLPASPQPHSAERAWVELRNALMLAGSDVVFCVPGDLALAVSYMNPATELVEVCGDS